jgi:hypothetical protein
VSRSIWNGRETAPKTRNSQAPVPVIPLLSQRLELHRLRCGDPSAGPIFANAVGKPLALTSVVNRLILPSLHRCELCGKAELKHAEADHPFKRDLRLPEWHGWHACPASIILSHERQTKFPKYQQQSRVWEKWESSVFCWISKLGGKVPVLDFSTERLFPHPSARRRF